MNRKQRQRQLIGELVTSLLCILVFGGSLLVFIYAAVTPGLGARSFNTPLDALFGHEGAMIAGIVISALFVVAGVAFAVRAIRLLRDPRYLDAKPPTWEDFM